VGGILEILDAFVRATARAYPFFFLAWIFRDNYWAWRGLVIVGMAWCIFALCVLIFPEKNACHIITASTLEDLQEIEMLGHEASQTPHTHTEDVKS
jgi:hypothetical protein